MAAVLLLSIMKVYYLFETVHKHYAIHFRYTFFILSPTVGFHTLLNLNFKPKSCFVIYPYLFETDGVPLFNILKCNCLFQTAYEQFKMNCRCLFSTLSIILCCHTLLNVSF